jgi:hypothetical protein
MRRRGWAGGEQAADTGPGRQVMSPAALSDRHHRITDLSGAANTRATQVRVGGMINWLLAGRGQNDWYGEGS